MKTLGIILGLCAVALVARPQGGTPTIFGQMSITNKHSVATNFVSTNLFVMNCTIIGLKSGGQQNGSTVYIGTDTNLQPYAIEPGTVHTITPNPGTRFNLRHWWLRTPTVNDGILIIYQ